MNVNRENVWREGMKKVVAFLILFFIFILNSFSQEIIENPVKPENPRAGRIVHLEEILRINDNEQDPFFRYPSSLSVGPDDCIYVYNDRQIYKFDALGKLVFNVVGRGQGPGEASMAVRYIPTPDGLLVLSYSPPKVMKFNRQGEFVGEKKLEKPIHLPEFVGLFDNKIYGFLEEPRLQGVTKDEAYVDFPHNLCEFDMDFKDTKIKYSFPVKNVVLKRSAWYPRARLNFIVKDSKSLFISHTAEYKIVKFNMEENKVEKIFNRKYKRIKYPPELNPKPRAGVITSPPREYYYDIATLLVYNDRLWVVTSTRDKNNNRLVDVYDMEGKYVDSFYLAYPEGRRPRNFGYGTVAVKGSHLYSVDEDEEGFFSIAIYSVIDDR